MKKTLLSAALLLAGVSTAQADILGVTTGYNHWATDNHGDFSTVYGQFEHFIPLIPNAAVRYSTMDDNKLKFDSYDAYGYYEILDNGNIALDLGFGLRRYEGGELHRRSFSDTAPMLNAEVVLFEDSRVSFYGKLDKGVASDTAFTDYDLGVRFNLFAGLKLQAGYRTYNLNLDGTDDIHDDERMKGFNLGLHWKI